MKLLKSHELVLAHLFDSDESLLRSDTNPNGFTPAQLEIKKRCMVIFSRKMSDPMIADKLLIKDIKDMFGVEEWTAYNDIRAVEYFVLGNLKRASKEYVRFLVTEAQKMAIQHETKYLEKSDSNNEYFDTKNLSYASKVLAEVNNLDKDDNGFDPSKFQKPEMEFTGDITVMDIEDIGEEKANALKRKYLKNAADDAEIINDDNG